MLNKNSIWIGIGVGLVLPFVGYAILLEIYDYLEGIGLLRRTGFSPTFRQRTLMVMSICLNLIPFNIFQRRKYTDTMRGLVIPTAIYVVLWLFYFGSYIL